jgi:hypothetical protein
MNQSLIIQLRDGAAPQWMVCNDDGHVAIEAVSGDLTQATAMSTGRRVVVILAPGEALATESDAPAKGAAKLAQVIPYALEERVADEIENLHFAIGERDSVTGRVAVVAARHAGPADRSARRRHADPAYRRWTAAGAAGAVHNRCLRDGAVDAGTGGRGPRARDAWIVAICRP